MCHKEDDPTQHDAEEVSGDLDEPETDKSAKIVRWYERARANILPVRAPTGYRTLGVY